MRTRLRAGIRLAAGFSIGLCLWFLFSAAYERVVAMPAEILVRSIESPAVTRLSAAGGEFLVERSDFPPGSPRPGLPAADLHFNFVLLLALFSVDPHPFSGGRVGRLLLAAACLFAVHVVALLFQVESVYATNLGDWSAAHYGAASRNLWAGGFHFYQIAGRFAAPFAIWWLLGRTDPPEPAIQARRVRSRRRYR